MANVLQVNNYMELAFAILHLKAYVHVWPNLCGALMADVWMQAKKAFMANVWALHSFI